MDGRDGGIGGWVTEGLFDEPGLVCGEGADEGVDVVEAF